MRRQTLLAATSLSLVAVAGTAILAAAATAHAQEAPVTFGTDPGKAHPRYAQKATYVDRPAVPTRVASSAPEQLVFEAESDVSRPATVTIEPGDTVYGIARRYGVKPTEIIAANALEAPYALSLGQTLKLPGSDAPADTNVIAAAAVVSPKPAKPAAASSLLREIERVEDAKESAGAAAPNEKLDAIYQVRKGDTLYSLSRRFEVSLNELAAANSLSAPYALSLGQAIVIPNVVPSADPVEPVETASAEALTETAPTAAPTLPAQSANSIFAWPIRGAIVAGYGSLLDGVRNDGINIAAPAGAPVRAAADGEVVYKGDELAGYGNLLLVKHADGWVSAYAHTGAILVKKGDQVRRGQVIAKVGDTGSVDAPQLHFELRHDLRPQDPIAALSGTLTNASFSR